MRLLSLQQHLDTRINGKNLGCVIRREMRFNVLQALSSKTILAQFRRHGCTSSAKSRDFFALAMRSATTYDASTDKFTSLNAHPASSLTRLRQPSFVLL